MRQSYAPFFGVRKDPTVQITARIAWLMPRPPVAAAIENDNAAIAILREL